ncbi:hypothetical protein ABFV45_14490, partial [Pseudomonas urmiensis]
DANSSSEQAQSDASADVLKAPEAAAELSKATAAATEAQTAAEKAKAAREKAEQAKTVEDMDNAVDEAEHAAQEAKDAANKAAAARIAAEDITTTKKVLADALAQRDKSNTRIYFRDGGWTTGHINSVSETSITFYDYGIYKDKTVELKDIKKIGD